VFKNIDCRGRSSEGGGVLVLGGCGYVCCREGRGLQQLGVTGSGGGGMGSWHLIRMRGVTTYEREEED